MRQDGQASPHPGALVVGASAGIGAAVARQLAGEGYRVALVARREPELRALCDEIDRAAGEPRAWAFVADVRDADAAPDLFARAARQVDPLELVIYAAGTMPRVATGKAFADEREMVETNLIGAMRWLSLAGEYLASRGKGTLVGISSVAGERGRPGNGAYMASKAGLSTYLDSLRFRLARHGVRVVAVKPGYVDTSMLAGVKTPKPLTVSADRAAAQIVRAARSGAPTAYVPIYWAPIMWVIRHLPRALVARLPG